jgi:hypothetical protein
VSDLDPIADLGPVRLALGAARQKHHRVTFVAPAGRDFAGRAPVDPGDAAVREAVVALFMADEQARLREARQSLAGVGVALYLAGAGDPVARWLRRAAAPRAR